MEEQKRYVRTSVRMEELRSRRERKHIRRTAFSVGLFLCITIVFSAVFFLLFFRVSEIRLVGNEIYANEQILEQLPFAEGDHLFSFRAGEVGTDLRKALPYIGSVTVRRELPSVVVVEISERHVDLSLSVGDEAYFLSGDLQVLGRIGGTEITGNLTRLETGPVSRCIVGETVSFSDKRTFDALKELYECLSANGMTERIRSIDMVSRFDISLQYEDRFTVYLGDMDNMEVKIRFLAGIIDQLNDTDRGYIYLSNAREASVRLEDTPNS